MRLYNYLLGLLVLLLLSSCSSQKTTSMHLAPGTIYVDAQFKSLNKSGDFASTIIINSVLGTGQTSSGLIAGKEYSVTFDQNSIANFNSTIDNLNINDSVYLLLSQNIKTKLGENNEGWKVIKIDTK